MPPDVAQDINEQRYRDRRPMTHEQYLDEPCELIATAFLKWEMDGYRAKLEAERQKHSAA